MHDVLEVKGELSQVIDYGLVFEDLQKKVQIDLAITINGVDDKSGYKLADQRRKEWVKVRTGIDKKRKEMNAAAREHIKRVDAVAAEFTELAGQAEDHVTRLVDDIDAEIAAAEQAKADAIYNEKMTRLVEAGCPLERLVVDSMTDEQIDARCSETRELNRLRQEECDRIAAAQAEADRLAAEQSERNRVEAEKLVAERAEFERQKSEQAAEFAKIKAEQEEQQRKIDDAHQIAANRERERYETEQQAERDRIADTEKAERLALEELLRPDREKLLAWSENVSATITLLPEVSESLNPIIALIAEVIAGSVQKIRVIVSSK